MALPVGNSIISVIDLEPDHTEEVAFEPPPFVVPAGFRPNSTFFGFSNELQSLEKALHNEQRAKIGSCSVLVCGPPGSGKTHLTREYLWLHKSEYPGGVFWIDSRSEESRLRSFWDIAQAMSLLGYSQAADNWSISHAEFVDTIRKWLEGRDGWLLVFDGVTIESDEVMQKYIKFLPDRKGNHIIFTSNDRHLAKRQRLLLPVPLLLQPLSEDDACDLLYNRIGIDSPTAKQAVKARELVNYFQRLPLAIHATGHRISARGQALERFNVDSTSTDERLAEPYKGIMKDLAEFKHFEAIALINILAFFDHEIPVAMIRLGRRGLADTNVEIRSEDRPGSVKRDLDETIAILMRYGLVERSLQRYKVTTKSSRTDLQRVGTTQSLTTPEEAFREDCSMETSSTTSSAYEIDVLRVHSVVQGFCRDELRDLETYESWLLIAMKLFICSYTVADEKMKGDSGEGLMRDYREYETHAARLTRHIPRRAHIHSSSLLLARHELHELIRSIRFEVERGSPIQSFRNGPEPRHVSVFDRSGSESSHGPQTPSSSPSRRSTWNSVEPRFDESPIDIGHHPHPRVGLGLHDGMSGIERQHEAGITVHSDDTDVLVSPSTPDSLEGIGGPTLRRTPNLSSPDLFLRHIFQGRATKSYNSKDVGSWHPAPPQATVTTFDVVAQSPNRPRALSSTSAGSEAEASLAAVHRISPPASRGGGTRSLSRTRPTSGGERSSGGSYGSSRRTSNNSFSEVAREQTRDMLRGRIAGLSSSPLANAFVFESFSGRQSTGRQSTEETQRPIGVAAATRSSELEPQGEDLAEGYTTSSRQPRLSDSLAAGVNSWYTSASHQQPSSSPRSRSRSRLREEMVHMPTGYTSTPMSRDISQESQFSQASEPTRHPPTFSIDSAANFSQIRPRTVDEAVMSWNSSSPPASSSTRAELEQPIHPEQRAAGWPAIPTSPPLNNARNTTTRVLQENVPPRG